MKKGSPLTPESFEALLDWLDPNLETGGQKYEDIRRRLIKFFVCSGFSDAEDVADKTVNRVAGKITEIKTGYTGEPARYFYGVAKNIRWEEWRKRRRPPPTPPPPPEKDEETQLDYECLEKCLQELPAKNRALVLGYYQDEKRAKIKHRQQLADELGIGLNAMRIRAYRIRKWLLECVQNRKAEAVA